MIKKIMICSGGFDPIHSGHIEMFKIAKQQCDFLVVALNSDEWLQNKKGINFLSEKERVEIIKSIRYVDDAFVFENDEFGSAINGIKKVISLKESYKKYFFDIEYMNSIDFDPKFTEIDVKFYFANGGDRDPNSTPTLEQKFCEENGVELAWNIGTTKLNSSSWILNRYRDWHFETTERAWGLYKVIYQDKNKKVKLLEVNPRSSLSLQSHNKRSEHWIVVDGIATVLLSPRDYPDNLLDVGEYVGRGGYGLLKTTLDENESLFIETQRKHKLINNTDNILRIIEVQYGEYVGEDDIIRYE